MPTILSEIEDEARRLLGGIARVGLDARLIGGMAVRLLAAERLAPEFAREIADLDFIVRKQHGRKLAALLKEEGYAEDQQFNAIHGARRLLFYDLDHRRQVDVFVGQFAMCHALPLDARLTHLPDTLPAAEVLMSKLQIVSLNAKDRGDLYALLYSHEVSDHDAQAVNARYVAQLTGDDWGLQHTFELNLQRLRDGLTELRLSDEDIATIRRRVDALAQAIDVAPKSRRWRLRARVGERKRWYEEPEEVDREA